VIEIIQANDSRWYEAKRRRLLNRGVSFDALLINDVVSIVEDVRARGDEALIEYTAKFDGVRLRPEQLRVDEVSLNQSADRVEETVLEALKESIKNVRAFHQNQIQRSWETTDTNGVRLGQRVDPIASAGLYVPGGTASYPSSVVMNVVPAQIAGVNRIVVVTPPKTLTDQPAVAAVLRELEVKEIYSIGGAQAIAALAYGTKTIKRVDKITGPGNKYVAAAKKIVFGVVGIDSIAGPSEVLIVADDSARPDFIAADLLAQAEHSEDAAAVLITTSASLAQTVAEEVSRQLQTLPRREIALNSLNDYGAILIVDTLAEASQVVNDLAPEHVQLMTRDDDQIAGLIRNAGAIFLGSYTPEALGDYLAGPNHVLPTGGTARFSSALGVYDFIKRTSIIRYSKEAMREAANSVATLAEVEGLRAHGRSALMRTNSNALGQ
jgi:histidinol dehydrogenase